MVTIQLGEGWLVKGQLLRKGTLKSLALRPWGGAEPLTPFPEKDVRKSLGLSHIRGMLRSSIQVTDPGAFAHLVKESK